MKTENYKASVKAGKEYHKARLAQFRAEASASVRLWEFGKALAKDIENCAHGVQSRIARELAKTTNKKESTWMTEISQALKCYNTYQTASIAGQWTLAEARAGYEGEADKDGDEKPKPRFSAKKKAESVAKGLTSAQIKSVINELKKLA